MAHSRKTAIFLLSVSAQPKNLKGTYYHWHFHLYFTVASVDQTLLYLPEPVFPLQGDRLTLLHLHLHMGFAWKQLFSYKIAPFGAVVK